MTPLAFGDVRIAFTDAANGDFSLDAHDAEARRRACSDGRRVTWLRQEHGARVVHVAAPGGSSGVDADGAVAAIADAALSVITADCAPVAVWSDDGVIGIAHAGWKGLVAGVIERVVDAVRLRADERAAVHGVLGPCIHAGCYEFGGADLDRVTGVLGPSVRASTANGAAALDVPAAVSAALARAGADRFDSAGLQRCTACDPLLYSWRARRDRGRQAAIIWRER